jgi:hypothetical protein
MEIKIEKGNNMKRIFAIIALIIITLWIGTTVVLAVFPVPMKSVLFPVFAIGCVILPIMAWIILWAISVVSGKKNIASFRSEEMEKTMKEADVIKAQMSSTNESTDDNQPQS